MENKWTSRKFVIAIFLIFLSTGLLCTKFIDQKTWSEIIMWVSIFYGLSNPASKIAGKFVLKGTGNEKS